MASDLPPSLLSMNLAPENLNTIEREPRTHESHTTASSLSSSETQNPSSSSQSLSLGDHRRLALSDFHDPLYYQQPLQLHCNLSNTATAASGYETGDRIRSSIDAKVNRDPKQKLSSMRSHVQKSTSTSGRDRSSKKLQGETTTRSVSKAKEKRKASKAQLHKRTLPTKKSKQMDTHSGHRQTKARRSASLSSQRQHKKKTLAKQRLRTSKGPVAKTHPKKSVPSARRLNLTNNRLASLVLPRRSIIVSNQSHRTSIPQLRENSKISMLFNSMKQQGEAASMHSMASSKTKGTQKTARTSSKKTTIPSKSAIKKIERGKSKRALSNGQVSVHSRGSKHQREGTSQGSRRKFPRCTSKTLVTIAPASSIQSNLISSLPKTKRSPSISTFASKTKLNEQLSTTSTGMLLTKNSAQLTSKNNNSRRRASTPRRGDRAKKNSLSSMSTGMTLRSRTIMIEPMDAIRRKTRQDE